MEKGEVSIQLLPISDAYTFILRDGYLEFYDNTQGPYTARETPDVLLDPEEVKTLTHFLVKSNAAL